MKSMKELGTKMRCKLTKAVVTAESAALMVTSAMTVCADEGEDVPAIATKDMNSIMNDIIGFICNIAMYVGIGILVYGLFQLYMSFKDENPDGKIKAITLCVVAIGLVTLRVVVNNLILA